MIWYHKAGRIKEYGDTITTAGRDRCKGLKCAEFKDHGVLENTKLKGKERRKEEIMPRLFMPSWSSPVQPFGANYHVSISCDADSVHNAYKGQA